MFWTWVSPNMEFATIFVGIIAILFFGLTFWQAVAAIAAKTKVPIATGERLIDRAEFDELFRSRAIDIVQPPGIAIPPIADMDAHHTIVVAALATKSSAATPRNA